ncbi:interleukin 15, like [Anarhichas minor]|uniref:interleukin 15, like n=1 Tax=Anarhichas minor TaxID=65739 RepID=UPI003F734F36
MLRGTSALVRVCLCLVCLLGQPAAEPRSQDLLKQVWTLIRIAPQLNDSGCRLYTPTAEDYKQTCPSSSLTCFSEEVQVLIDEWAIAGVLKIRHFRLKHGLGLLAAELKKTESKCRRCERLPEKEAKTFLHELKETLQKFNNIRTF